MTEWITRKPHPDEKQREAVQGEFFSSESLTNEAQALVREGIQNSLDAAVKDPETGKIKPKVRIYISGKKGALPWSDSKRYFETAWPHYEAENSGLINSERPARGSDCPFLVFEDFGTSGLTGDMTKTTQPSKDEENSFYFYLRAEGQSGKSDSDRGRWGIGKFVFPKASLVRSFLALSNRQDDGVSFVTGQFILKWHAVDGEYFSPDGWFGTQNENRVLLPSTDPGIVESVTSDFELARRDEPGLSLIVPWCRSDINRNMLVECVLRDFYYPILKGQLEVEVADPDGSECISSDTFDNVLRRHKRKLTSDEVGTIMLAKEATESRGMVAFRALANPNKDPSWSDDLLEEETKSAMKRLLNDGSLVSIRVPVWVHKKSGFPEKAVVRVWIQRDETATGGRPIFIREGLVIPAAHSTLSRGFRSLVLIEDKPIARLLGDAENPSHTMWDPKSEHFQGRYPASKGARTITFVRTIVSKLVEAVIKGDGEKDLITLANVFRAQPKPTEEEGKRKKRGKKPRLPPVDPPPPSTPKLWRSSKLKDGFSVYGSGEAIDSEKRLTVKVGYDVARGNPITRWSPLDFTLDEGKGIQIHCHGAGINQKSIERSGNKFIVKVTEPDFRIEFHGFDHRRDLYVKPYMKDAD